MYMIYLKKKLNLILNKHSGIQLRINIILIEKKYLCFVYKTDTEMSLKNSYVKMISRVRNFKNYIENINKINNY